MAREYREISGWQLHDISGMEIISFHEVIEFTTGSQFLLEPRYPLCLGFHHLQNEHPQQTQDQQHQVCRQRPFPLPCKTTNGDQDRQNQKANSYAHKANGIPYNTSVCR